MSCSVKLLAVVVMVAAASAAAGSAAAWPDPIGEDRVSVVRVKVPVGDLDLAAPAGADELLRRLDVAAGRACGNRPGVSVMMVQQAHDYRRCKAKAVRQVVAAIDAPLVRQRYAERNGGPVELAEVKP